MTKLKTLLIFVLSSITVIVCIPPHAHARQLCQNQLFDYSPNGSGDAYCADFWVLPHRGIWTSVFGAGPLWQMNWKAPSIEAEVTTTGQYQCTDHIGRTFTLHVLLHRWFDYADDMLAAGLTYEQTESLLARDAALSVVVADLYAGASLVPVAALCLSYTGTDGVRGSVLFVSERVPREHGRIHSIRFSKYSGARWDFSARLHVGV